MNLSQLVDPAGYVRECLQAYRFHLQQFGVPDAAVAAQRVSLVAAEGDFPVHSQWLHVFTALGAVVAEFGDVDLEVVPESHGRALRLHAMAEFYLSHLQSHPAVATAAFDHLEHWLRTRPELQHEGAKQHRHERAKAAGDEAGKVHSERGTDTDRLITAAWAKLAARGVSERGRSKGIASDLRMDQSTVNKRVKALNLRAK